MNITMKKFFESAPPFARAVIKQSGGWQSFKEDATDIAEHGADCGFHGFIYYTETVAFAERNLAGLVKYAQEQAADYGSGLLKFLSGFKCLKDLTEDELARGLYTRTDDDVHTAVMNALAWYALEETANCYVSLTS